MLSTFALTGGTQNRWPRLQVFLGASGGIFIGGGGSELTNLEQETDQGHWGGGHYRGPKNTP